MLSAVIWRPSALSLSERGLLFAYCAGTEHLVTFCAPGSAESRSNLKNVSCWHRLRWSAAAAASGSVVFLYSGNKIELRLFLHWPVIFLKIDVFKCYYFIQRSLSLIITNSIIWPGAETKIHQPACSPDTKIEGHVCAADQGIKTSSKHSCNTQWEMRSSVSEPVMRDLTK